MSHCHVILSFTLGLGIIENLQNIAKITTLLKKNPYSFYLISSIFWKINIHRKCLQGGGGLVRMWIVFFRILPHLPYHVFPLSKCTHKLTVLPSRCSCKSFQSSSTPPTSPVLPWSEVWGGWLAWPLHLHTSYIRYNYFVPETILRKYSVETEASLLLKEWPSHTHPPQSRRPSQLPKPQSPLPTLQCFYVSKVICPHSLI